MESLLDEIILSKKNKSDGVISKKSDSSSIGKIIKKNLIMQSLLIGMVYIYQTTQT